MAGRIRTIKPEWLENQRLGLCSNEARLLSVALLLLADDYGNGRASPMYLAGHVWTYSRDPRESVANASRAVRELVDARYLALYEVDGQEYFHIPGWARHQRVDKPGKPRVPGPDSANARELSRDPRESLAPDHDHDHDHEQDHEGEPEGGAHAPCPAEPDVPARGRKKPKPADPTPEERATAASVLGRLNERSGRRFESEVHVRKVVRLLRQGHTETDLRMVVWDRANRWAEDERMSEYLRPSTLFGPEKFPDYLAEARAAWGDDREQAQPQQLAPLLVGLVGGRER